MLKDRNGVEIKEGYWIVYKLDLSTTDLQHCEVVRYGKKED